MNHSLTSPNPRAIGGSLRGQVALGGALARGVFSISTGRRPLRVGMTNLASQVQLAFRAAWVAGRAMRRFLLR